MASVEWRRNALGPLLDLPAGWRERIVNRTNYLRRFPELGTALAGRHAGRRRLLVGPYVVVYAYDADRDVVSIMLVIRSPLFR